MTQTDGKSWSCAVVIPTYNEAAHIADLLREVATLPGAPQVIVVDDDSPDGTAGIVEAEAKHFPGIRVILRHGRKGGRGGACLEGYRAALGTAAEFIGEMDADQYHDPQDLPRLVEALVNTGADIAIGSRYLQGGSAQGWPVSRRIFSRAANLVARLALGIPLTDCTNGFRLFRRAALDSLLRHPYRTRGYIVLSEMADRAHRSGLRFTEIPVICLNCKSRSNFSLREIVDAFLGLISIRMRRWIES